MVARAKVTFAFFIHLHIVMTREIKIVLLEAIVVKPSLIKTFKSGNDCNGGMHRAETMLMGGSKIL